ncbi:hypothetical protein NUK34_08005 [Kerstersia gyiorum]|uniref:hypothetical protein n=1 Tax=Kerstersia gyiorum TaxID=206506 RepID=UPI0021502996|nr:hypothetical protein [Kerstersia gyiorum]MCR4158794.1 hypothetical protein [Kerstersia gyiorum]
MEHNAHVKMAVAHRLHSTADYAAYNYGARSKIAKACAAGDARGFMANTDFVTQDIDIKLANLQDFIAFRLPRTEWEA